MIRNREGLLSSGLADAPQFDVAAPLSEDEESKALKNRNNLGR
jgi:hypothetical protein